MVTCLILGAVLESRWPELKEPDGEWWQSYDLGHRGDSPFDSRDGGDMIEDRHCSACGDWMGEDEAICPHCGHDRYGVDPDDWQEAVG